VGEDGGLIAGHARVLAARQLGIAEIPVMVAAGWSEAQKRAYVLADNQLAITGSGWDPELLRLELGELGSGKTRSGAEWVRAQVAAGRRRIALVAPTAADARDVIVEGESGILAVSPAVDRPNYEPSKRRLTWPNGAIATTYSADEPERLRGPPWSEAQKRAYSKPKRDPMDPSSLGMGGARSSPDRADALVWAFTELLVEEIASWGIYETTRRKAEAVVKARPAVEAGRPKSEPAPGSMEYQALHPDWVWKPEED
jgi:phage terminase large subunit-like protein